MHPSQDGPARDGILVVANATCPCPALLDHLAERARDCERQILIVAPALNSRLAHWVSDTDAAVRGAEQRLAEAVAALGERGVEAHGRVGDADPGVALADWVAQVAPAEIVISTHPPGQSHWLEGDLVASARERYDAPVTHLISAYGVVEEEPAASAAAA